MEKVKTEIKKDKNKPKKLIIKPKPIRLEVKYPIMQEPKEMKKKDLVDLVNYMKKMSNDKWIFLFSTPQFMRIIP